jgi:hypothetical protein
LAGSDALRAITANARARTAEHDPKTYSAVLLSDDAERARAKIMRNRKARKRADDSSASDRALQTSAQ